MPKRIERTTSLTAQMNCAARAASFCERDARLRCQDDIAQRLLPGKLRPLLKAGALGVFYRALAPRGMYEYVALRTKYIDDFLERAGSGFRQALIFGAGFDTRAVRFARAFPGLRFFELDSPPTQAAKRGQFEKRGVHSAAVYVPVDFDRDCVAEKLDEAGFSRGLPTLFLLEGLTMYLQPASIDATFRLIAQYAGPGSAVVFDFVRPDTLAGSTKEGAELRRAVSRLAEPFAFSLEPAAAPVFLAQYGLTLLDLTDAAKLEQRYLGGDGSAARRVNTTHVLATAGFQCTMNNE